MSKMIYNLKIRAINNKVMQRAYNALNFYKKMKKVKDKVFKIIEDHINFKIK